MSDRLLDKEDFQAWKEHPATRWVLDRLQSKATVQAESLQDLLLQMVGFPPTQWAEEQPQASLAKGFCEGLMAVVEIDYEDLLTDEEAQAIKEAEEKAKN